MTRVQLPSPEHGAQRGSLPMLPMFDCHPAPHWAVLGPRRRACGVQLQRMHLCRRGLISWIQKCSSLGLKPGATSGGGLRTAPCKVLQAIWGSLWIQEIKGV